ncbi:MAG: hypothetical protein QHH74_05675 [Spirochaetota bacterium]|nr:hypothetical protein [Spirochaetota bacterium]
MNKNIIYIVLLICAIVHSIGCSAKKETHPTIQLVILSAYNCNSCSAIDDTIEYLQRIDRALEIKKVDIHNPEGAMYVSQYHLWRIPVYLFLDGNGMELYRLEGEQSRSEIEKGLSIAKQRITNRNKPE